MEVIASGPAIRAAAHSSKVIWYVEIFSQPEP
jgi:hypothetical protein